MTIKAKNGRHVVLRKLNSADFDSLFGYLEKLSIETKKRFGPHQFDKQSIVEFYQNKNHLGYIAQDAVTLNIVAYSIIKTGYLEHDNFRLQSYGWILDNKTDFTFAPSVTDLWQSCGIGNALFQFILSDLKPLKVKNIILWGGVQADNNKAVNFYKKNGFHILGEFQYNGHNYDMALQIY